MSTLSAVASTLAGAHVTRDAVLRAATVLADDDLTVRVVLDSQYQGGGQGNIQAFACIGLPHFTEAMNIVQNGL